MNNSTFGNVVTALITPFTKELSIDFKSLDKVIEHLIASDTASIVVSGTTGESPTLEDSEKIELLEYIFQKVNGRAKIIFGAGSNNTHKTIQLINKVNSIKIDGLLIVAPYYNKPNQRGIIAHFSEIAHNTQLPIMVYNIPGRTGINIENDTIIKLHNKFSHIKYVKDSTGNLTQFHNLATSKPDSLMLYSGDDDLTLPFIKLGAIGVVSVASHLVGSEINQMIEYARNFKYDKADLIHHKFLKLFKNLFIEPNPTCVKYALSQIGLIEPYVRLPLVELSDESKKLIDESLNIVKPLSKISQ